MAFEKGSEGLKFYQSGSKKPEYDLPCKVSCANCHAPIMDEGRNTVLLFPGIVKFKSIEEKEKFYPQYV